MPLRHEGKEGGSGPLKGEFGMTCSLKPAEAIEKNTVKRLSFPQTPHGGRPRSAIPDTKRLQEGNALRVSPDGVRDGGCLSAMRARRAIVVR